MIVVFDFETGGVQPHHPNIQLAAVACADDWSEAAQFEQKIQFDVKDAEEEALRINSYQKHHWSEAEPEAVVIKRFCEWLKPFRSVQKISRAGNPYTVARLCGHNAASFDFPRLKAASERAGEFLPADFMVIDTLQGSIWDAQRSGNWPERFKLTDLCKHYGIPVADAHDALGDCRMTAALARKLLGN